MRCARRGAGRSDAQPSVDYQHDGEVVAVPLHHVVEGPVELVEDGLGGDGGVERRRAGELGANQDGGLLGGDDRIALRQVAAVYREARYTQDGKGMRLLENPLVRAAIVGQLRKRVR